MSFLNYASQSEAEFLEDEARNEAADHIEGLANTPDEFAWAFPSTALTNRSGPPNAKEQQ